MTKAIHETATPFTKAALSPHPLDKLPDSLRQWVLDTLSRHRHEILSLLHNGRHLLKAVGWCQGAVSAIRIEGGDQGTHYEPVPLEAPAIDALCAIGAVRRAAYDIRSAGGNPRVGAAQGAAMIALEVMIDPHGYDADRHNALWEWNDAPERTREDVLALFDRTIEMIESLQ